LGHFEHFYPQKKIYSKLVCFLAAKLEFILAANQYVFGSKPVCFWQTSMFHAVSSVVYGISKNTHNIHSQLYKTYKSWS
jgi:hypothetical protein